MKRFFNPDIGVFLLQEGVRRSVLHKIRYFLKVLVPKKSGAKFFFIVFFLSMALSNHAQPIKAITFNIRLSTPSDGHNQWELRKKDVLDFLHYEEADFIGMQEVLWSQIEDLESELGNYHWIGVGRDDGEKAGEFSPIFYDQHRWELIESNTFWLSESPDKPSKSWDAALPRVCSWGLFRNKSSLDEIYVFNTHLDHRGAESRLQSVQLILARMQKIATKSSVILLGDFNLEPTSTPIKTITKNMQDTFQSAKTRFGSEGTFNGFNHQKVPSRRIDYVFTSFDLMVSSYGVASHLIEGRYLSDHFPIIVKLDPK